jgi:large subunit ribosomal protein L22
MTKAILKNYRQSPRKVRLVADAIRGKKVNDAITTLNFMPKRAADPVKKVVESALANAKSNGVSTDDLIVKEILVDDGPTMKRWMPRARGSASPIRKRTSHIKIVLGTIQARNPKIEITEEKTTVEVESTPVKKANKKDETKVSKVTDKKQ